MGGLPKPECIGLFRILSPRGYQNKKDFLTLGSLFLCGGRSVSQQSSFLRIVCLFIQLHRRNPQPIPKFLSIKFAFRKGEDRQHCIGLRSSQLMAIQFKKYTGSNERSAFVAIDKWMVLRQGKGIGSGKLVNVGLSILEMIQRASHRRLKQPFITETGSATVFGQQQAVDVG